jgi:antitoxin MazE
MPRQCPDSCATLITVEDGRVIITPHGDEPLALADRLALFDPLLHAGEAMATVPVGREAW